MSDTSTGFNNAGVDHFGIVVRDIKQTISRLESLGIGPFERFDPQSMPPLTGDLLFNGKPIHPKTKLSIAPVGGVMLEIFEPDESESPWREFLDTKGEGIHHVGILVDDIDEEIEKWTRRGATILQYGRWEGGGGGIYLDTGAGNIIIEILKY